MTDGSAADEDFGDGTDFDRAHDAAVNVHRDKFFLQGEGVDDGAQHAHVVGGRLLDVTLLGEFGAADDVAATHDDGDLNAGVDGEFDFPGDVVEVVGINAEPVWLAE